VKRNYKGLVFVLLLLSHFLINSFAQSLSFEFNNTATVIVHGFSEDTSHILMTRYKGFLPTDFNEQWKNSDVYKIIRDSSYLFSFDISCPTEPYLIIDSLWIPIFLIPADTLWISLNFSNSQNPIPNIKFGGKLSKINNYYWKKYLKFGENLDNKRGELIRANLEIPKFQTAIDSIYITETNFLLAYNSENLLPDWFILYKISDLKYRTAFEKIYQINYRQLYLKIIDNLSEKDFDFLKNTTIQNEEAKSSIYYNIFLYEYFNRLLINEFKDLDLATRRSTHMRRHFRLADSLLSNEVKDVYKTTIVHRLISIGLLDEIDSLLNRVDNVFSNQKYLDYLKGMYVHKTSLIKGANAPNFYLPDIDKNYKSLLDFNSKIILIKFWYPGCKACQIEHPYEDSLVYNFKDEDFQFVNICVLSSEENWEKYLDKFGSTGISLFANANWQKKLTESYKISSYPHYTLIDKNGKIFENTCKRPSSGIENDIKQLLNSHP